MAEACGLIQLGKLTVNGLMENNSASTGGGIRVASNSSEIHFADVTVQEQQSHWQWRRHLPE